MIPARTSTRLSDERRTFMLEPACARAVERNNLVIAIMQELASFHARDARKARKRKPRIAENLAFSPRAKRLQKWTDLGARTRAATARSRHRRLSSYPHTLIATTGVN